MLLRWRVEKERSVKTEVILFIALTLFRWRTCEGSDYRGHLEVEQVELVSTGPEMRGERSQDPVQLTQLVPSWHSNNEESNQNKEAK